MRLITGLLRAALITSLLSACTFVEVYRGGERVERRISFGVSGLPKFERGYMRAHGLGLSWSHGFGVLGYMKIDLYAMPPDCGAVVITDHPERIARLVDLSKLCVNGG